MTGTPYAPTPDRTLATGWVAVAVKYDRGQEAAS